MGIWKGHLIVPSYNGPIILLSIIVFGWFVKKDKWNGSLVKRIVRIAPFVLGVYLLHDHWYVRSFLWNEIVDWGLYVNSFTFLPIVFGTSIVVFLSGVLLDYIRAKLFQIVKVDKLVSKIDSSLKNKVNILLIKYNIDN